MHVHGTFNCGFDTTNGTYNTHKSSLRLTFFCSRRPTYIEWLQHKAKKHKRELGRENKTELKLEVKYYTNILMNKPFLDTLSTADAE